MNDLSTNDTHYYEEGATMLTTTPADESIARYQRGVEIKRYTNRSLSRGYTVDYGRASVRTYNEDERVLNKLQVTVWQSPKSGYGRWEVQVMTFLAPEERTYAFQDKEFHTFYLPLDAAQADIRQAELAEAILFRILDWWDAR